MSIFGTGPEHTLREGLPFIDALHAKFDREREAADRIEQLEAIVSDLAHAIDFHLEGHGKLGSERLRAAARRAREAIDVDG